MAIRMNADPRAIVLVNETFPPYRRSGVQLAGSIAGIMES